MGWILALPFLDVVMWQPPFSWIKWGYAKIRKTRFSPKAEKPGFSYVYEFCGAVLAFAFELMNNLAT